VTIAAVNAEVPPPPMTPPPAAGGHARTERPAPPVSAKPPMRSALGPYQRLMLSWSRLHPYNAVHLVTLPGPPAPERLARAAGELLAELGWGTVRVEPDRGHAVIGPTAPAAPTVETPDPAAETPASLAARELNHRYPDPFAEQPFPLRLFTLPTEGPGETQAGHTIGVSYAHWVSDGVGMAGLVRTLLSRYAGWEPAERVGSTAATAKSAPVPPTRGPAWADWRRTFWPKADALRLVGWAVSALRDLSRLRYSYRGFRTVEDPAAEVRFPTLPADAAARLPAAARRMGATVHDLFLAATAEALAAHFPDRLLRSNRRHAFALGSIVDLRGLSPHTLAGRAGLYLGHFMTFCRGAYLRDFPRLVRHIRQQTAHAKAGRGYLRSVFDLEFADATSSRLSPAAERARYRENVPLSAGLSNVRLPAEWFPPGSATYRRAVPTGPIMPLVLAPTTAAGVMTLGVTAQAAAFPDGKLDGILAAMLGRLLNL
jgi:hypothetical protein